MATRILFHLLISQPPQIHIQYQIDIQPILAENWGNLESMISTFWGRQSIMSLHAETPLMRCTLLVYMHAADQSWP